MVGGLEHVLVSIIDWYKWIVILPIDEAHHFSRWLLHHQPSIVLICNGHQFRSVDSESLKGSRLQIVGWMYGGLTCTTKHILKYLEIIWNHCSLFRPFFFYDFMLHLMSKQNALKYLGRCQNQRSLPLSPSRAVAMQNAKREMSPWHQRVWSGSPDWTFHSWHWKPTYIKIRNVHQ
jgi:hypothetical protein